MLILLPPSEGKWCPTRGRPLDLDTLAFPSLRPTRMRVLDALVDLCRTDPERARGALGLTPGLASEISRDAGLRTAPTAAAGRIYSGVLYAALGLADLPTAAKRRAAHRVLVTSALFGLLRPGDRIPAYRLGGGATLPGPGTMSSVWREPLAEVLGPLAERQLILDLRSTTYAGLWRPPRDLRTRVIPLRVLHESAGTRTIVSHFNKATKGRLVADLLNDGADPGTPRALRAALERLGWTVEERTDSHGLDVIITEIETA